MQNYLEFVVQNHFVFVVLIGGTRCTCSLCFRTCAYNETFSKLMLLLREIFQLSSETLKLTWCTLPYFIGLQFDRPAYFQVLRTSCFIPVASRYRTERAVSCCCIYHNSASSIENLYSCVAVFKSLPVSTILWFSLAIAPASCTRGTGSFPGVKAAGAVC